MPSLTLDPETYALVLQLAQQRGCSPEELIRALIEDEAERLPQQELGLSSPAQELLHVLAQSGPGLLTAASYRGRKLYYAGNTTYPKAHSLLPNLEDVDDAVAELVANGHLELHADGTHQITLAGYEAARDAQGPRRSSKPPLPRRPRPPGA